jgi:hypothetical protein
MTVNISFLYSILLLDWAELVVFKYPLSPMWLIQFRVVVLTISIKVLLENHTVVQLVKNFPKFCGTKGFITLLTRVTPTWSASCCDNFTPEQALRHLLNTRMGEPRDGTDVLLKKKLSARLYSSWSGHYIDEVPQLLSVVCITLLNTYLKYTKCTIIHNIFAWYNIVKSPIKLTT